MERSIPIKSKEELELLRQAGKILASIIAELKGSLKIGMTGCQVNERAEELIIQRQATPAFKGYRGFPSSACISFNHEVVHGIPSDRVIKDGDLVSIDIGIVYKNYFSDTAFTVGFGKISPVKEKLLNIAESALYKGIAQALVGNRLYDISASIQNFVEANHFSVVRDFVGHGIGRKLHEDPEVPNYGTAHSGPLLKEGMVLAIEPMVNIGTWETQVLSDGWTVVTKDGKPSAHFEHTIAITPSGPEILTELAV